MSAEENINDIIAKRNKFQEFIKLNDRLTDKLPNRTDDMTKYTTTQKLIKILNNKIMILKSLNTVAESDPTIKAEAPKPIERTAKANTIHNILAIQIKNKTYIDNSKNTLIETQTNVVNTLNKLINIQPNQNIKSELIAKATRTTENYLKIKNNIEFSINKFIELQKKVISSIESNKDNNTQKNIIESCIKQFNELKEFIIKCTSDSREVFQTLNVRLNKITQQEANGQENIKRSIEKDTILVVMPTYNRSENIENSIAMINAQTYNNLVFLIIDDGSSENHKHKFREIQEKYQSTKIVFQENEVNCHIAKTLNKGIQYLLDSCTDFTHFTWISDDNEYYSNFLAELYKENTFFKYGSYNVQELNFNVNTKNTKYKDFDDILNNFAGCASFMWTKEAINEIGFNDETVPGCEDFEYLLRTFQLNANACNYTHIPTMKYIRHANSLMEQNREAIMNIKHQIVVDYKSNNSKKYSVSIVMAYFNRKPQTLETLNGFERTYSGKYNFEVIIVDDDSNEENRLEEDIKQFSFPIKLIVISKEEKMGRINSCIPYNKGFKAAKGEVIIIQNPECLHIGNLLEYIKLNFKYDSYLSFPCYNSNNYDVNNFIKQNIEIININNIEELTKSFNQDINIANFPIWYQHPTIWNKNLHFCTAIDADYLHILGGFDESYKFGVCFEDDSFIFNIKEILKLDIICIDLKDNVGVLHQYHGRSAGCNITSSNIDVNKNATFERFLLNQNLFNYQKNNNKPFDAPKIIHYYWDNFKKFSYLNLYSLKSSVYYNSDFIHIIWVPVNPQQNITWNEIHNKEYSEELRWRDYVNDINNMKNVKIIYKNIAEFLDVSYEMSEIHKSDLFRYKIICKYGGIWCDLDIVFVKKITELIDFHFDSINFLFFHSTYLVTPIGFLVSKRNTSLFKLIYNTAKQNYDKNRYQCMGAECLVKIFTNSIDYPHNFNQLMQNTRFKYLNNGYLSYSNNDNEINIIMDEEYYMNFIWNEIEELFIENTKIKDLTNTVGFHWFNGSDITKKYLKEITDYTIPDKFNGIIFSEKAKFHVNIKTITYFSMHIDNWAYFFKKKINNYINIINVKYPNIQTKEVLVNAYCKNWLDIIIDGIDNTANNLCIFDELSYTHLLYNYKYANNVIKQQIADFLCRAKYICFFCELFVNNSLETIGNKLQNKDFTILFFKNAKNIYLCNTKNINYLIENNIYESIVYSPPICYSIINNYIPLIKNNTQEIDILFYGNIDDLFFYRTNGIEHVKQFAKSNNYNCVINDNLHDDTKNNTLINTKIVIHIPSHDKLHTFPWAKVGELMCNKIFFIIEENEEMYIKNLDKTVIYYQRNNMIDLQEKLKYYLDNEGERNIVVDNCFEYIKNNYNMDTLFDKILF
jgi:GT2 family glycosyltransferase